MSFIKCPRCKCMRDIVDFEIYKGIRRKSCLKCKANNAKYKTNTTKDNDLTQFIRHQRLFRKLNNEFLQRSAKPVHIYQMKHVFVDIRDHRIYSDKEFSHTNY